jgi:tight adherence protein C
VIITALPAAAAVYARLARRWPARTAAAAAACVVLVAVAPLPGLAAAATAAALGARARLRRRRLREEAAGRDVTLLADLVALGLRAGLGLPEALRRAVPLVHPDLAAEVEGVLRAADRSGSEAALAAAGGRAARLYRMAARAAATGAPLADAVEGFAVERRHADHARAVEDARRLPVRMLVPLALLILPGFVVLAVGPALLEALARLQLAP